VICTALSATKGQGGEALLNVMKGRIFESPRGQVLIDAQTRDIVQDIYIRKVERVNAQLWNVEFDPRKRSRTLANSNKRTITLFVEPAAVCLQPAFSLLLAAGWPLQVRFPAMKCGIPARHANGV